MLCKVNIRITGGSCCLIYAFSGLLTGRFYRCAFCLYFSGKISLACFPWCIFRSFSQFVRNRNLIDIFFQEVLYLLEFGLFCFTDKSNGASVVIGACCTSDAVYIIFAIIRNIVIDNQSDIIYIDAALQCRLLPAY